jgi:hypothetical protein
MEREPYRVAETGGELPLAGAIGPVAHDRGPAAILLAADVARRPHADVERAVGTERDSPGPVMRAGGQLGHHDRIAGGVALRVVAEADDAAGLPHVEVAVVKREPVRELEPFGDGYHPCQPAGQGDDPSLGGQGDDQRAGGVDGQPAGLTQAGREDLGGEAGGEVDRGGLRAGGLAAPRLLEQRRDRERDEGAGDQDGYAVRFPHLRHPKEELRVGRRDSPTWAGARSGPPAGAPMLASRPRERQMTARARASAIDSATIALV